MNLDRLRSRLTQAATQYYARIDNRLAEQDASSVINGVYKGYDAASTRHLVQVVGGNIVRAQSITTGAVRIGDRVTLTFAKGSSEAFMDAMPH